MGFHHLVTRFVLFAMLAVVAACSRQQLGLPRIPVSAVSPDGRWIAAVRNHPSIDPPSQSIWLQRVDGSGKRLRTLGPDSDWCNTIVWSKDSSTVAFLVQDAKLTVVDARTGEIVSDKWLTEWAGEYPPHRMVRDLSLSADGREARFQNCLRRMTQPGYVHDATDCRVVETMAIR